MKKNIIAFAYLLSLHLGGLFVFSLFRILLFIKNINLLQAESIDDWSLQITAFFKGIWFDNVISCYILIVPLTVASVCGFFNYFGKRLYWALTGFMVTLYTICFAVAAANMPYFSYFFKNINSSILNWLEYESTTIGMMTQEIGYWIAIFCFFIATIGYGVLAVRSGKVFNRAINNHNNQINSNINLLSTPVINNISNNNKKPDWQRIGSAFLLSSLMIGLCLFGIRGRMGYNPIKVSAAYYCEDPFLNQLGLNAAYNLFITVMDDNRSENRRLQLMDDQEAIRNAKKFLASSKTKTNSSFVRPIIVSESKKRPNVILIFMESMSAKLMQSFGQDQSLTPFLDSIYHESLSFRNIYSAGIHTNHGLYSTLYSFPTILKRNAMKGSDIPKYTGLPTILRKEGYENMFFMTHEAQYDNMNAFLRTNGYQEIYSQEDYPEEEVVNSFGVSDEYLFEYALQVINRKSEGKNPFFATLLTISNHPPYILPETFKARSEEKEDQIVEYADYALRQFMQEAHKQSWFDNTLFVFLGDHGKMVDEPESEMPDAYNHVPLMIYSPLVKKGVYEDLGGQIDVAPTLLGLLNIQYKHQHLGIDLLRKKRECIFYTADNMIGCRDKEHLFLYAPGEKMEFHYLIGENGTLTLTDANESRFNFLKTYSFSMLQVTEYLVQEKKTKQL